MARVAPNLPTESDLLCESCGYTLNGLPADARCPECGEPVQASIEDGRTPSAWERKAQGGVVGAFFATMFRALFRPTVFFRRLSVRGSGSVSVAQNFGRIMLGVLAILFGCIAAGHWMLVAGLNWNTPLTMIVFAVAAILTPLCLHGLTTIAARLTNWEGTYRGYRLPLPVVKKCMAYHYVHYLPVALLVVVTTIVFLQAREGRVPILPAAQSGVWYLYVVAGEVVLSAAYLFWTYWIAMRNVMYANR